MPFAPRRLLLTYDDAGGLCGRVVPRMARMLEDRAFEVTVATLAMAPPVEGFTGLILGTPVGLRGKGPTEATRAWVAGAAGLDEVKVALFSAFWAFPGGALAALRAQLGELGAEVVVDHGYWLVKPTEGEHLLPAECMIRIR